jgi:hypothetical protein
MKACCRYPMSGRRLGAAADWWQVQVLLFSSGSASPIRFSSGSSRWIMSDPWGFPHGSPAPGVAAGQAPQSVSPAQAVAADDARGNRSRVFGPDGPTRTAGASAPRSIHRAPRKGVPLMVPHRSRSNRTLTVVALTLVLAATLASCGRGADTPPTSSRAAATASSGCSRNSRRGTRWCWTRRAPLFRQRWPPRSSSG